MARFGSLNRARQQAYYNGLANAKSTIIVHPYGWQTAPKNCHEQIRGAQHNGAQAQAANSDCSLNLTPAVRRTAPDRQALTRTGVITSLPKTHTHS